MRPFGRYRGRELLAASAPFTSPLSVAGCVLWLRADLGVTIATGVSAWADQSGGSMIASVTQGTGSAQPTLNSSNASFGNQKTLAFTSAASKQLTAASASLALPYTCFIVANETGAGGGSLMGSSDAGITSLYINGSDKVVAFDGANFVTTVNGLNAPFIMACVFTSTACTAYVNSSASSAAGGAATGHAMTGTFFVGATAAGLGIPQLNGDIAELAIYNTALNTSQISKFFAYAGNRYGKTWV